jgi:hypothetical protein
LGATISPFSSLLTLPAFTAPALGLFLCRRVIANLVFWLT